MTNNVLVLLFQRLMGKVYMVHWNPAWHGDLPTCIELQACLLIIIPRAELFILPHLIWPTAFATHLWYDDEWWWCQRHVKTHSLLETHQTNRLLTVLPIWGDRSITSRKSIASRGPARSINRSPCFLMATAKALRKSKNINFFNIEKLRSYLVNFSVNYSISHYVLYFKLMFRLCSASRHR